jgi:hypothetical protein
MEWAQMTAMEPRLSGLLADAKAAPVTRGMVDAAWSFDFRPRMERLVGFDAERPELRTSVAYEVASAVINRALRR